MDSLSESLPATAQRERPARRTALAILLFIGWLLPTAITWIYFVALEQSTATAQQLAFGIGKCIQFLLPLLAWAIVARRAEVANSAIAPVRRMRWSSIAGAGSGMIIAAAMLGAYFLILLPNGWMDAPRVAARAKMASLGLDSKGLLLTAAIFYSLIHSGLEEYYWRWFVFGRLTTFFAVAVAVVISSVGFMAHHVLVLARYFGWDSPLTFAFSLGVAVGGVVWAELYRRSGTLVGSWISHALVDAAIFTIAFHLTFADVSG